MSVISSRSVFDTSLKISWFLLWVSSRCLSATFLLIILVCIDFYSRRYKYERARLLIDLTWLMIKCSPLIFLMFFKSYVTISNYSGSERWKVELDSDLRLSWFYQLEKRRYIPVAGHVRCRSRDEPFVILILEYVTSAEVLFDLRTFVMSCHCPEFLFSCHFDSCCQLTIACH